LLGKFWPDFFKREDIPHIINFDFENDFLLKYGAKSIKREVLEALRKAVKKDIEKRYRSVDEFGEVIFKALKIDTLKLPFPPDSSAETRLIKKETKKFDFYFTLPLPFHVPDETYSQTPFQYRGEKELTLSNYQGIKIAFDGFYPTRPVIKDTSLYSVTIADNTLILNFKNNEFFKILNLFKEIEQDMEGELHFKGVIEVEGEIR
jgi:hypothetical protein